MTAVSYCLTDGLCSVFSCCPGAPIAAGQRLAKAGRSVESRQVQYVKHRMLAGPWANRGSCWMAWLVVDSHGLYNSWLSGPAGVVWGRVCCAQCCLQLISWDSVRCGWNCILQHLSRCSGRHRCHNWSSLQGSEGIRGRCLIA